MWNLLKKKNIQINLVINEQYFNKERKSVTIAKSEDRRYKNYSTRQQHAWGKVTTLDWDNPCKKKKKKKCISF